MANPLQFDIDADGRRAQQELRRLGREVAKLKEQNSELARESKKSGDEQERGADRIVGKLTSVAAGYMSVSAAIGVATRALRDYEEQSRRANEAQKIGGLERVSRIRNTPAGMNDDLITRQLEAINLNTGVPLGELELGAGMIFSRMPAGMQNRAIPMLGAAARMSPESGETAAALGATALGFSPFARGVSNEGLLGFVQQGANVASVSDVAMFAENVGTTAQSLSAFGDNLEQSMELSAAFTRLGFDITGKRSGTGLTEIAKKLATSVPEAGSTAGRLEFLMGNRKRAEEWFDEHGSSLPSRLYGSMQTMLLDPNSEARKNYLRAKSEIFTPGAETEAAYADIVSKLGSDQVVQAAVGERRGQAAIDQLNRSRRGDALSLEAREITEKTLASMGVGYIPRSLISTDMYLQSLGGGAGGAVASATEGLVRLNQYAQSQNLGEQQRAEVQIQIDRLGDILNEMRQLNATIAQGQQQAVGAGAPNAGEER